MDLAKGAQDVALTPQPKAKRRSALAGVKELGEKLAAKQAALAQAEAACNTVRAECAALKTAYDLVKPQPRTRKGAK